MLADFPTIPSTRMEGPESHSAVMGVVAFVEKHLAQFSERYAGSNIQNENGLNQELSLLLNFYARKEDCLFFFQSESMQDSERGNSPKVDFSVLVFTVNSEFYHVPELFFSMEGKRLGQTGKIREKEYLIGREENGKYNHCGGVERFKTAIHGRNLQHSAIIGYVQIKDFHYWQETINEWIDKLIEGKIASSSQWSEKDKLQLLNLTSNTAKFRSENSRKKDNIILFHLWVKLLKP
ncbi:MAG: hypothetical protein ACM3SY_08695 [Candidatus Omnitrophota bacterium]